MEKHSQILQMLHNLKKSLKKVKKYLIAQKRKSESWQQCLQFYRNHQTSLSSYHIVKLIKIIYKPLKYIMKRDCRHLSVLITNFERKGDGGEAKPGSIGTIEKKIREQVQGIGKKISILQNIMQSYTLALQRLLTVSDPSYFKMIFAKTYTRKLSSPLIFESGISLSLQVPYSPQIVEHQMNSFLKFVGDAAVIYSMCMLCCASERDIVKTLNLCQRAVGHICESSNNFIKNKYKLELLKLNFIYKFPDQISISQPLTTLVFSNILSLGLTSWNENPYSPIQVNYQFPLELIYQLYKNYRRQQRNKLENNYKLILRYLFCTVRCMLADGGLGFNFKAKRDLELQIYMLMKEIMRFNQYINFNTNIATNIKLLNLVKNSRASRLSNFQFLNVSNPQTALISSLGKDNQKILKDQFSKNTRQFISIYIEQYDNAFLQQKRLCDFISKFLDFSLISKVTQELSGLGRLINSDEHDKQKQKQAKYKNKKDIMNNNLCRKQQCVKPKRNTNNSYNSKYQTSPSIQTENSIKQNQSNNPHTQTLLQNQREQKLLVTGIRSTLDQQVLNVYNIIGAEDCLDLYGFLDESDSEGEQGLHDFQKVRRKDIRNLDNINTRKDSCKPSQHEFNIDQKNTLSYMPIGKATQNMQYLYQKSANLDCLANQAIQQLSLLQGKVKSQRLILGLDPIRQSIMKPLQEIERRAQFELQYQRVGVQMAGKMSRFRGLSLRSNRHYEFGGLSKSQSKDRLEHIQKQTYLPLTIKPKMSPLKQQVLIKQRQHQPIHLSDRYDKMSQMLLLSNTNKESNLNI